MLNITLANYSYWFIVAILFLILETFFIPGIGMLFIGLGCLSTGFMLSIETFRDSSLPMQFSSFCLFTVIWCLILWNYIKRNFFGKASDKQFGDLIGTEAQIYEQDLYKNKTGQIRWSGSIFNAKIDDQETAEFIIKGDTVIITSVKGNTVLVRKR